MLLLSFRVGAQIYALDSGEVREVLPLLKLKPLPLAESYVAGLLNFRGEVLPVIDTCALLGGAPCKRSLSTRIIVVKLAGEAQDNLLGLIAERVTETLRTERNDFQDGGIDIEGAPFLGPVLPYQDGMLQLVDTDALLPAELRARLYSSHENQANV